MAGHSPSDDCVSLCKATYSTREQSSAWDHAPFLIRFFGGLLTNLFFGDQLTCLLRFWSAWNYKEGMLNFKFQDLIWTDGLFNLYVLLFI